MIVFAAIMPHPPESIPGIGNAEDFKSIEKTLKAFEELRLGLEKADPETIVIISPHANLKEYSFGINSASELIGNFSKFGLDKEYSYVNDSDFVERLRFACRMKKMRTHFQNDPLDYGALIPLYHLTKNIKPKIVHLAFSLMGYDFHHRYGETLQNIIEGNVDRYGNVDGRRVAIIASADLSHRLTENSPAGFSPKAKEFDLNILHHLGNKDVASIMQMDQEFVAEAAECGMRSIIILLGALHGKNYDFKLLSYEGPFGIGYLTARLI